MLDVAEIGKRILAELQEFEHDDVFTLLNTVVEPTGSFVELQEYISAVTSLVENKYVVLGFDTFGSAHEEALTNEDALALTRRLSDWFVFDRSESRWKLSRGDISKERHPILAIEPAGVAEAGNILEERGYRWWRRQG